LGSVYLRAVPLSRERRQQWRAEPTALNTVARDSP
jgi:hypothetical protein